MAITLSNYNQYWKWVERRNREVKSRKNEPPSTRRTAENVSRYSRCPKFQTFGALGGLACPERFRFGGGSSLSLKLDFQQLDRLEKVLAQFVLLVAFWSCSAIAQTNPAASLTIHADKPGPQISPTLYGIFFEEINCAGDGGLYAELIRNRSFEESSTPVHWRMIKEGMVDAEMSVDSMYSVSEKNEHYLKMKVILALEGFVGVANSGYWEFP